MGEDDVVAFCGLGEDDAVAFCGLDADAVAFCGLDAMCSLADFVCSVFACGLSVALCMLVTAVNIAQTL